jgi:hypothetical protein
MKIKKLAVEEKEQHKEDAVYSFFKNVQRLG